MIIELIDGPTGTELERRGYHMQIPLWSASVLEKDPDLITSIHRDYLSAGATIVTANTFRTNPETLRSADRPISDAHTLTQAAIQIARNALHSVEKSTQTVRVAGSHAPVGDCYTPGDHRSVDIIRKDAELHCAWMVEAGCDLLLLETMNSLVEAELCAMVAQEHDTPFIVSLVTDRTGTRLLDGTDLWLAVNRLMRYEPEAILTNCASPQATLESVRTLSDMLTNAGVEIGFGGYPNSGDPDPVLGWECVRDVEPAEFDDVIRQILDTGARYVGSCCGTTPAETARIAGLVAQTARN